MGLWQLGLKLGVDDYLMTDYFLMLFLGGKGSRKPFFSGDGVLMPRSSSSSSLTILLSIGLPDLSSEPALKSFILNLLPDESS